MKLLFKTIKNIIYNNNHLLDIHHLNGDGVLQSIKKLLLFVSKNGELRKICIVRFFLVNRIFGYVSYKDENFFFGLSMAINQNQFPHKICK